MRGRLTQSVTRHASERRFAANLQSGWSFFWGLFFFLAVFFFWSIFLVFSRKNPTFLKFWTDFLSFPLGFRWFFMGKNLFFYILDGFPVISLRFSLVFLGGKPYFPYILDRYPVISFVSWALKHAWYGLKEAGGVGGGGGGGGRSPPTCKHLLGFEARSARLPKKKERGGWGGAHTMLFN